MKRDKYEYFFYQMMTIILVCFVIWLMWGLSLLDHETKQLKVQIEAKDKLITDLTVKGLNRELGQ